MSVTKYQVLHTYLQPLLIRNIFSVHYKIVRQTSFRPGLMVRNYVSEIKLNLLTLANSSHIINSAPWLNKLFPARLGFYGFIIFVCVDCFMLLCFLYNLKLRVINKYY